MGVGEGGKGVIEVKLVANAEGGRLALWRGGCLRDHRQQRVKKRQSPNGERGAGRGVWVGWGAWGWWRGVHVICSTKHERRERRARTPC